jgi:hypothetical protein
VEEEEEEVDEGEDKDEEVDEVEEEGMERIFPRGETSSWMWRSEGGGFGTVRIRRRRRRRREEEEEEGEKSSRRQLRERVRWTKNVCLCYGSCLMPLPSTTLLEFLERTRLIIYSVWFEC